MAISEDLKELYSSGGSDVVLHTLSLSHITWEESFYIVRDYQDWEANLEDSGPLVTFKKTAFSIEGPEIDVNGNQKLNITIDAVNRSIIDLLEVAVKDSSQSPIEVTYRLYIDSDNSGPQNDPPLKLYMRTVNLSTKNVSGYAELVGLENRKFPNVNYGNVFQSLIYAG